MLLIDSHAKAIQLSTSYGILRTLKLLDGVEATYVWISWNGYR